MKSAKAGWLGFVTLVGAATLASFSPESWAEDKPGAAAAVPSAINPVIPHRVDTQPRGVEPAHSEDTQAKPALPVPAAPLLPPAQLAPPLPPRTAEAKPATVAPSPSEKPALTWNGVTLYGVVDVGIAYLSHGSPASSTYGPGLPYVVQSYSNHSTTSLANNGLSQSKLGLSGIEPLGLLDLQALFKLETGFQPTSGRLTDGPRSLLENNGRANADKVTAGDSSRAGQVFQGEAYVGLGSVSVGTLTFGRQNSLMADDLLKYDPQLQSQAFSPIGYSGLSGGLGATESKTLDQALKCKLGYGPVRAAALYQFGKAGVLPEGAVSADLGLDLAGFSVDLLWGRVWGAVSLSSLNATQNAAAPGTLAATASDNTAYAVLARFATHQLKLYAGYQHISYANPKNPLPNGTTTIGGYTLSTVNNKAYSTHKVLQYAWGGARYAITSFFELSAAYYQFRQNSYAATDCSDSSASSCSGIFHDASLVADYRLSLRFDVYTGVNYSRVVDGMAAGFFYDHNWTSMTGLRFMF